MALSHVSPFYHSYFGLFSFRNCISNPRLSSNEILYASFFCKGIREMLSLLLHIGKILNETSSASSFTVSSDVASTKNNPIIVRFKLNNSVVVNAQDRSFNPIIVRFKLTTKTRSRKILPTFNPIIVRFKRHTFHQARLFLQALSIL